MTQSGYLASNTNSLFSNFRRICFSHSKRSWKDAPSLFISTKSSRPPELPPSVYPRSGFIDNPLALYISDMPHPPNTQLALYAYDTAILAQSWRTDNIIHRLTHPTSVLLRYFTSWKLQVNIHKTEAILFTRRRPVPPAPLHF